MKIRSRVITKKKRKKFEIHYFDGFGSYGVKEIERLVRALITRSWISPDSRRYLVLSKL